jgi:N-acetylmuramoyl-L-alanine amidase
MTRPAIITSCTSPNHDARAASIDMLILHYTGMATGAEALARLCDATSRVSAHYLIEEDGRIFALVSEDRRAWHAGVSSWAGVSDINACSIGIELVNPGHATPGYAGGYRPFPEAQMAALIALARDIVKRHVIPSGRVLGHSDVAPGRKVDPGELFDWQRLAAEGLGVWPKPAGPAVDLQVLRPGDSGPDVYRLKQSLRRIGYGLGASEQFDEETRRVVQAFQRHFWPARLDGVADRETRSLIQALLLV